MQCAIRPLSSLSVIHITHTHPPPQHGGNKRFLEYCKSKGIPAGNPSSTKYSARAFDDYRRALSAEADAALGSTTPQAARTPRSSAGATRAPAPAPAPARRANDAPDGWDGWGDMEASLAAIERKQRATSPQAAARAPERARTPERAKSPAKAPTPTPAQAQSKTAAADPLDGWSGWGDTEASLAEIERKQQQSQQRNQRNAALYGNSGNNGAARTKRYESVSSDDFAQQQQGQGPQPGARSFQAYGPGAAGPASYQQGATPALADALSSGWSRLSSLAKTVAQQTQRAVQDSGILDAVHGLVSGTGAAEQGTQRASLLGDSHQQQQQAQQQQPVQQSVQQSLQKQQPVQKQQQQFVGPTAASQGLKPATGPDDEFDELVHGKGRRTRTAQPAARRAGDDAPLDADLPDVDAWLDSTLAMEAARQASTAASASAPAPARSSTSSSAGSATSTPPHTAETPAAAAAPTAAASAPVADSDLSELGDDWDTW